MVLAVTCASSAARPFPVTRTAAMVPARYGNRRRSARRVIQASHEAVGTVGRGGIGPSVVETCIDGETVERDRPGFVGACP